jgi:hypothetical protein
LCCGAGDRNVRKMREDFTYGTWKMRKKYTLHSNKLIFVRG